MLKSFATKAYKIKSIKALLLIVSLVGSSMLAIIGHNNSNNNYTNHNLTANNDLSGFHISIKESNVNLVNEKTMWNVINQNYHNFVANVDNKNIINVAIDDFAQITNTTSNDDIANNVKKHFAMQMTNIANNILPGNAKSYNSYFAATAVGRSIAKTNLQSAIHSFGDVYLPYKDNYEKSVANDGLFAIINRAATFNNDFSIPYNISASKELLAKDIKNRFAMIALNNNQFSDITNQPTLVMLATNKDEALTITNVNTKQEQPIFTSNNISYAVITHNPKHKPKDNLAPTNFTITVKSENKGFNRKISLTNNVSKINFTHVNSSGVDNNIIPQYLVKDNNNKKTLIVMNQAPDIFSFHSNGKDQDKWLKWDVNSDTLAIIPTQNPDSIKNGDSISVQQNSSYQVYCIAKDIGDSKDPNQLAEQAASMQFITVYKSDSNPPTFKNCTNFCNNNADNQLLAGFKQYLSAATNNDHNIISNNLDILGANAGEMISWFIGWETAINEHTFNNYLDSKTADQPWAVDKDLRIILITVHDNWNVIIMGALFIGILVITPIIVIFIRRKKRLK